MKTALVIGATGLVGKLLTIQLLESSHYKKVITFTRRRFELEHPKYLNHVINFDQLDRVASLVQGDDFFSCLGTTLKRAGSLREQYKVDFHYQLEFAKIACKNSVGHYLLVSSAGANANSIYSPYLRMKGQLENAIQDLPMSKVSVIRPSVLVGAREDERFFEGLSSKVLEKFKKIPLFKKYRPIEGSLVARAIINAANLNGGIYELDELFELSL